MSDILISQEEADRLLGMEKFRGDEKNYLFPRAGETISIPLKSRVNGEDFILDIRRARVDLLKNTFQTRARKIIVLARLDLCGGMHRNPDGVEIPCPHLHLYREGYDARWAYTLPTCFKNPRDMWQTLEDFMKYCNIIEKLYLKKS